MKQILILLACLFFISANTYAGTPPFQGCSSLGCIGVPENIYLNPNGDIQLPPMGNNSGNLNCSLANNAYITLKRDHIHFKEMYSMILTAHTAQKQLYLRVVAGSPNCEIYYSVFY